MAEHMRAELVGEVLEPAVWQHKAAPALVWGRRDQNRRVGSPVQLIGVFMSVWMSVWVSVRL
jgi:hypothetical protein